MQALRDLIDGDGPTFGGIGRVLLDLVVLW